MRRRGLTTQIGKRALNASACTAVGVACAFALQLLISGLALGASPASFSDGFVCAQTSSGDDGGGAPAAPAPSHHAGCCILHHAAVDAPPLRSASAVGLDLPAAPAGAAAVSSDALKTAPELAPLAARAPPLPRA